MKQWFTLLFTLFIVTHLSYAQRSQNVRFFISGGSALPVESFLGSPFTFPQLNEGVQPNFGQDVLGIAPSASNFDKYWENGLSLGGGLEYRLNNYISLLATFDYSHFIFNKNLMEDNFATTFQNDFGLALNRESFEITQGGASSYAVGLNAKLQFPVGIVTPYVTGGGGYFRIDQQPINFTYYDEFVLNDIQTINFYDRVPPASQDALMARAGGGIVFNLMKNVRPFVEADYILGMTDTDNTIIYPLKFGFLFSFD